MFNREYKTKSPMIWIPGILQSRETKQFGLYLWWHRCPRDINVVFLWCILSHRRLDESLRTVGSDLHNSGMILQIQQEKMRTVNIFPSSCFNAKLIAFWMQANSFTRRENLRDNFLYISSAIYEIARATNGTFRTSTFTWTIFYFLLPFTFLMVHRLVRWYDRSMFLQEGFQYTIPRTACVPWTPGVHHTLRLNGTRTPKTATECHSVAVCLLARQNLRSWQQQRKSLCFPLHCRWFCIRAVSTETVNVSEEKQCKISWRMEKHMYKIKRQKTLHSFSGHPYPADQRKNILCL